MNLGNDSGGVIMGSGSQRRCIEIAFLMFVLFGVSLAQGQVTVTEFKVKGNSLLSTERLQSVLQDLEGKSLSLEELKGAADRAYQ